MPRCGISPRVGAVLAMIMKDLVLLAVGKPFAIMDAGVPRALRTRRTGLGHVPANPTCP
jgi:hypothetical protein